MYTCNGKITDFTQLNVKLQGCILCTLHIIVINGEFEGIKHYLLHYARPPLPLEPKDYNFIIM